MEEGVRDEGRLGGGGARPRPWSRPGAPPAAPTALHLLHGSTAARPGSLPARTLMSSLSGCAGREKGSAERETKIKKEMARWARLRVGCEHARAGLDDARARRRPPTTRSQAWQAPCGRCVSWRACVGAPCRLLSREARGRSPLFKTPACSLRRAQRAQASASARHHTATRGALAEAGVIHTHARIGGRVRGAPPFVKTAGPAPSHHIDLAARSALGSRLVSAPCVPLSRACVCSRREGVAKRGAALPAAGGGGGAAPGRKKVREGGGVEGSVNGEGASERALARLLARPFSLSPHSRFFPSARAPPLPTAHPEPRRPRMADLDLQPNLGLGTGFGECGREGTRRAGRRGRRAEQGTVRRHAREESRAQQHARSQSGPRRCRRR